MHDNQTNATSGSLTGVNRTWFLRVSSAAFYAFASFMIMVVNKRILTVYKFPSFQVRIDISILAIFNIIFYEPLIEMMQHFKTVTFMFNRFLESVKCFPQYSFYGSVGD